MNIIIFKRYKENNVLKYEIKYNNYIICLSEYEIIEITVSLLRGLFEIQYLKERKHSIFKSSKKIPILILEKKEYNLKIILHEETIKLQLFEFDLIMYTMNSFDFQCKRIYKFLNKEYGNGILDFKIFSPTYLEHMLGVDIPRIKKVKYTGEQILSLFVYDKIISQKVRITQHCLFKQLQSGLIDCGFKNTNHIFESNNERIRNILVDVIKQPEQYPIVVYGEEDVVRDGTHRLACLYFLYGNIEIPVIRIFVSHPYYSYTVYKATINKMKVDVIK